MRAVPHRSSVSHRTDSTLGVLVCARARTVELGSTVCDLIEIKLGVILQIVDDQISVTRPRVNLYSAVPEKDPFLDPSLLDPLEGDQHEEIQTELGKFKEEARNNELPEMDAVRLDQIFDDYVDAFRASFSSRPPAKLRPLKIELTKNSGPAKVRLRNYSQEQ